MKQGYNIYYKQTKLNRIALNESQLNDFLKHNKITYKNLLNEFIEYNVKDLKIRKCTII